MKAIDQRSLLIPLTDRRVDQELEKPKEACVGPPAEPVGIE